MFGAVKVSPGEIFSGCEESTMTDVRRAEYMDIVPAVEIMLVEDRESRFLYR